MALIKDLISPSKYDIKAPYSMVPKGICIHNTGNDATARNEANYMKNNNNEVSFHIVVDDIEAIQLIPFNRNAWHSGDGGNGDGNRNYIAVEICYSKSGGTKFDLAEVRASKEIALIMKEYGFTINNIKRHYDFSRKNCPERTMSKGWDRFLNMIQKELNLLNNVKAQEVKYDMKNLVCYCNAVDKRASEYLADFLQCPCIDATIPFNYEGVAENIIAVGGNSSPIGFSGYTTKYISGKDRYDTLIEVLKYIGKL